MIVKLLLILVLVIVAFCMIKVRRAVPEGQIVQDPLTGKQKFGIWVLCFLNPIIAGAVFYYGWKKKLPVKAKQANQISLWAFFIILILAIFSFTLAGLNDARVKSEIQNSDQSALIDSAEFKAAFEGKSYGQAVSYCESFDVDNKDYCLITLATQATFSEEDTVGVEMEICPRVSDDIRILCYVMLERCDSIKDEETKNTCKAEVERKNQYIREQVQ